MSNERILVKEQLIDLSDHEQCKQAVLEFRQQLTRKETHIDILSEALAEVYTSIQLWGTVEKVPEALGQRNITHDIDRLKHIVDWCIDEVQTYVNSDNPPERSTAFLTNYSDEA